jgi:hypothetical protein
MPATSSKVTMIFCGSTRRACERPKLPNKPEPPAREARRATRTNRATRSSVGPKPRSSWPISDMPGLGDWALTCTSLDCRRFVRLALSQNEGTSVENRVVGFAD